MDTWRLNASNGVVMRIGCFYPIDFTLTSNPETPSDEFKSTYSLCTFLYLCACDEVEVIDDVKSSCDVLTGGRDAETSTYLVL